MKDPYDGIPSYAAFSQMRLEARKRKNELIARLLAEGVKTQAQIALEAGCSLKTVQRRRKSLTEQGLLK